MIKRRHDLPLHWSKIRRMRISIYGPTKLTPFWIFTVEYSGVRSWWRHRFQIASFSPSTLENSVFKKHRFQIAPLWRAFSNGSVFGDRFRRCSVDDSRKRSKTAPFSFENGLVRTRPQINHVYVFWRDCFPSGNWKRVATEASVNPEFDSTLARRLNQSRFPVVLRWTKLQFCSARQ